MISHGYSVKEKDDPIVRLAELGGEQLSAVTEPGAFIVDLVPACESPESRPVSRDRRPHLDCSISSALSPLVVSRDWVEKDGRGVEAGFAQSG